MAQTVSLNGVDYSIPDPNEKSWGAEVTAYLVAVAAVVSGYTVDTVAATAALQLDPTKNILHLNAASAVTLHATTAILDGANNGQVLILFGTSDTNTVTVPTAANTALNGNAILKDGDSLSMIWDSVDSLWRENARNT